MKRQKLVNLLFEDAEPSKIDYKRFPKKMGQAGVDVEDAKRDLTGGLNDGGDPSDDMIGNQPFIGPARELKPTQDSMDVPKLCNFFIAACRNLDSENLGTVKPFANGIEGPIKAIIASDNQIMDGHHRWGAVCMVDPEKKIGPDPKLDWPAEPLIAVLNTMTVHVNGKVRTEGKKGKTPLATAFQSQTIKKQLSSFLSSPDTCWGAGGDKDILVKTLQVFIKEKEEDESELINKVVQKIEANLKKCTIEPFEGSSGKYRRQDMPVIETEHVKRAVEMLNKGEVDVNPPYSNESHVYNNNNIILERWQKIAGIIKG